MCASKLHGVKKKKKKCAALHLQVLELLSGCRMSTASWVFLLFVQRSQQLSVTDLKKIGQPAMNNKRMLNEKNIFPWSGPYR